jgi:hypothetical protein
MAEFGVAPQAASTSTTSDPMSDPTLQLATQPPEAGVPAPAIMFSDPSDPAPPYAVVAQAAREAAGAPVVNNFFFSMAPDGTRRIRGHFGPALTAMLVSLDVHTRYWPELAACVCQAYTEEDVPDVLRVCGVPELHIPYLLLLISAEGSLPIMS